jgi:hypothetical protein
VSARREMTAEGFAQFFQDAVVPRIGAQLPRAQPIFDNSRWARRFVRVMSLEVGLWTRLGLPRGVREWKVDEATIENIARLPIHNRKRSRNCGDRACA